jgi:hypothetical protein
VSNICKECGSYFQSEGKLKWGKKPEIKLYLQEEKNRKIDDTIKITVAISSRAHRN